MASRKLFLLAALLGLASLAISAADSLGQQQLPAPTSPYPDLTGNSPYGTGTTQQQGVYPTQQPQVYQPQQQQQPPAQSTYPTQQPAYPVTQPQTAAGGGALMDVLGQFRLSLGQDVQPMAATYNFALPGLGSQVTIMSLAQAQALAAQRQNFQAMVPQMGGRITDQRQISVGGKPADLVTVVMQNNQTNQQFVVYNVFLTSANLWVQIMGPAQAQAQVQQAANQVLQGLQTR